MAEEVEAARSSRAEDTEKGAVAHVNRDRRILAALKAAAEFLASRPDVKSADVLKVAESRERWGAR